MRVSSLFAVGWSYGHSAAGGSAHRVERFRCLFFGINRDLLNVSSRRTCDLPLLVPVWQWSPVLGVLVKVGQRVDGEPGAV
jgi:hypothetical protein